MSSAKLTAMVCRRLCSLHRLGARAKQIFALRTFNAFTKSPRAKKLLVQLYGHLSTPMARAHKRVRLTPKFVVDEVIEMYELTVKQAAMGQLTHDSYFMLATAWKVACEIEDSGEIRGLARHLEEFNAALQSIYNRCMKATSATGGIWTPRACTASELKALSQFVSVHRFQLSNILHTNLIAIGDRLAKQERAAGPVQIMNVEQELQKMRAACKGYEMHFPQLVAA